MIRDCLHTDKCLLCSDPQTVTGPSSDSQIFQLLLSFNLVSLSLYRVIEELTQQKHSLALRVEELEVEVCDLSSFLRKKEQETQVRLSSLVVQKCKPKKIRIS